MFIRVTGNKTQILRGCYRFESETDPTVTTDFVTTRGKKRDFPKKSAVTRGGNRAVTWVIPVTDVTREGGRPSRIGFALVLYHYDIRHWPALGKVKQ